MYQFHQQQIAECDAKVEALLKQKVCQTGQRDLVYEPAEKIKKKESPKPILM